MRTGCWVEHCFEWSRHDLSTAWAVVGGCRLQMDGCSSYEGPDRDPNSGQWQGAASQPQQQWQPNSGQGEAEATTAVIAHNHRTVAPGTVPRGCGGRDQEEDFRHRSTLAALASVGTTEGPEVQLLQESLRKTKRAAQESPIAVQVAQSESFVERARKRLEAHDASRVELVAELEASQARLARLKAMAEKPIIPDASFEVAIPRAKLASVEEERDAALQARPAKKPGHRLRCGFNRLDHHREPSPLAGGFLSRCATKTYCGGCKIAKATFGTQPWQAMLTRWQGCAMSWVPQPQVGQQSQ